MSVTPAGWYADPQDASQVRYWDGQAWTEHTSPAAPPSTPAAAPPTPAMVPPADPFVQQPYYGGAIAQKAPGEGLYRAAAIINWVVLGLVVVATLGIGIIAAAWFVPMTLQMHKHVGGHTKHTALGVCTLLFCNVVSGILILVGDSDRRAA